MSDMKDEDPLRYDCKRTRLHYSWNQSTQNDTRYIEDRRNFSDYFFLVKIPGPGFTLPGPASPGVLKTDLRTILHKKQRKAAAEARNNNEFLKLCAIKEMHSEYK